MGRNVYPEAPGWILPDKNVSGELSAERGLVTTNRSSVRERVLEFLLFIGAGILIRFAVCYIPVQIRGILHEYDR